MSEPKRTPAPPVPCAFWLTVRFTAGVDNTARRRVEARLSGFLSGTSIRAVVSTRLIGLHDTAGFVPFEVSLILAWLSAQREVQAVDFLPPVPTLLSKGVRHG